MKLTELNFYPLMGLFGELYEPDLKSLSLDPLTPNGRWTLKRANSLFWAQHFDIPKLKSLINRLQSTFQYTVCNLPQYVAILENPNLFIQQVTDSPIKLADQGISPQSFFSAIETLTILCKLYSDFAYKPFKLTIEEGFILNEFDTKQLVQECLNPPTNPYFNFIKEHCWPVIEAIKPDLVWMLGPIRFSTFTMAMLTRKAFPNSHICVVGHSSEYYSLNKVTKYLESNELLFSIIDSIILCDIENTQKEVIQCLENGDSLDSIPNLLYFDRKLKKIQKTSYKKSFKTPSNWVSKRLQSFDETLEGQIDPSEIVNIKLWPNAKCYWDKCTFCGINRKYETLPSENNFGDIDEKINLISQLVDEGCRYFWSIDEAVPPEILEELSHKLLENNIKIFWQARSKIDSGFSQEVCNSLAKSGLREIRLGLESANYRILKLMNKFPEDFDFDLVEAIVERFHQSGVSVHFPIIVGFPTETFRERMETFDLLRKLKNTFSSFTFNVNSLGLDVTSKLFTHYEKFDITTVKWPCPARYFLGNLIDWDSDIEHFDRVFIDEQRNDFMRQVLYPWMPKTAITPSYIIYRLSETSRITLVWKTSMFKKQNDNDEVLPLNLDSKIQTTPHMVYSKLNRTRIGAKGNLYRLYDWNSHNHIECDEDGLRLLKIFQEPQTLQSGVENLHRQYYQDSLSIEQAFEKYLPQLQIAYQLKMIVDSI